MKDATLAQGNQVLNLILQKQTPAERLQAIIESGLLSDLLDAANVDEVKRDEFRHLIGLKPLILTFTISVDPAKPFVHDMTEYGWNLLEYVSESAKTSIVNLELVSFLENKENRISSETMKKRAGKLGTNLDQRHAEYLLEHQEEIPAKYRNYCLLFPGTVWQDLCGNHFVPCLRWGGERWHLYFGWLEDGWDSGGGLLRLRK